MRIVAYKGHVQELSALSDHSETFAVNLITIIHGVLLLGRAQLKRCDNEKRPAVGAYFVVAFNTHDPIIVLGIAGFIATGSAHYTALIPAYAGAVFVLLLVRAY